MVGETLNDRYRIERRLGGGSQAEVFLATDVHMERLVAIKIWKPEGGFTVDEFLREAKLLARFGAPHFVTIHEHAATLDQRPFFVLEYLQGETLQDLSTPLTAEEVCRCVRDVCVGLQKAHDEGVVHRDLKPSNLMLVDRGLRTERYVILDLGIAKITDTSNWRQTLADATMAGAGTLLYMSPEQCNGNPIDQRTDVYAFGCLLFMLLVQEEPFANKAGSHLSVLNAILSDPPRRLAEVRPDGVFSEALEQLVQDCLAKKPEERPASMLEVEARFEACTPDNGLLLSTSAPGGRSGPGSSGIRTRRPIGSSTHPNRRPKRRLLTVGFLALVATAAGGLAFFLTRPSSEATSSQKTAAQTPLTQTPLTQSVGAPKVNGTHASPEKTKEPLLNPPVKQVSTGTTEVRTSRPTEPVATRTESHTPIVPPIVKKPVIKPPTPPSTKDDHYFVVRNRTLSADDAFGKNKEQNRYGVLANDGLPSGKSYEAECVEQPRFGQLHLNKDGTFTYACTRPDGDLVPADRFRYRVRVSDNEQWSEPESVVIAIRPFSDEEDTVIKRIERDYGPASIRKEENPPTVIVDFAEQRVKKPILDVSLSVLDGLGEVLRELQLDAQPITDSALEHLRRFPELRILSLAGTDVSAAGLPKLASLKNLTDVDLSDTLLAEADVVAFASGAGRPRVRRDGKIDRVRNLGVAIAGKNDLTRGRNAFVGTIPAVSLGDFQKISLSLKEAPRLVGLVVSNPEIGDESLTDSWVRELKFLKSLDLRGTLVSPQQIALFKKEFPSLKVEWDRPLEQLRSVGTVTESGDGLVAIDLSGKKVDSRTWTLLSQVDKLATLNLSGVLIDGVGFQRLLQLTGLRKLTLQETPLPGKQVLEVCHAIPSLVELDVQKSPIAQENNVLRALQAELQSHDAKGKVRPEPVALGPVLLAAPFNAKDVVLARAAWAGYLNSPEQSVNSIGMRLQLIPPGEFRMGSEDTYLELLDRYPAVRETEEDNPGSRMALESARPQHVVGITRPYYLGAYEVTNAQFNKFLEATGRKPIVPKTPRPGWGFQPKKKAEVPEKKSTEERRLSKRYWGNSPDPKVPPLKPNAPPVNPNPAQPAVEKPSDQAPVVNVTWEDAVAFCEWLSVQKDEVKDKRVYRLPTEAEWEYACRAGSTTRFWKDDDPEHLTQIGNVRDLAYKEKYHKDNTLNSSDGAADACDVGQYPPNQFDLYDMHGNVAEWCSDWFSRSYYRQAPQANPTGPSTGALRVVRGGSWHSSGIFSRSANRAAELPKHRFDRIGFRVVCVERRAPWPPVVSAPVAPVAGPTPQLLVAPFEVKQAAEARKAWAQYAQIDEVDPKNLAGLSMTLIPPGEFMMGSTPEQIDQAAQADPKFKKESGNHEQPLHRVRITRPFYLSAHEVTREQFTRFVKATGYKTVGERPSAKPALGVDLATGKLKPDRKLNWHNAGFAQDDSHPVVYVSWRDALAFCTWLTWQEGRTYRLPTEAEWEYACRAGTTTLYYNGDDAESLVTVGNVIDETAKGTFPSLHALKARDGFVFTAPVGSFKANAFGLFDMHGNVREWCADWNADDYYARSPEADPPGASTGKTRVLRGGAWSSHAAACRSASRGGQLPYHLAHDVGFRVAADPPAK